MRPSYDHGTDGGFRCITQAGLVTADRSSVVDMDPVVAPVSYSISDRRP